MINSLASQNLLALALAFGFMYYVFKWCALSRTLLRFIGERGGNVRQMVEKAVNR